MSTFRETREHFVDAWVRIPRSPYCVLWYRCLDKCSYEFEPLLGPPPLPRLSVEPGTETGLIHFYNPIEPISIPSPEVSVDLLFPRELVVESTLLAGHEPR
jgi:hypothetical protein